MAGTPDPRRLPAIVLKKVQDIVRHHSELHPDEKDTFMVTATLQIDATTGKIVDLHAISGWSEQPDGSLTARYGVINVRDKHGSRVFGMLDKPEVHTENE